MSVFSFNNNDPRAWTGRDGRAGARGVNHRNSRLTEDQVRQIKFTPSSGPDGVSDREMARLVGCSDRTVRGIRDGRAWKHITREDS